MLKYLLLLLLLASCATSPIKAPEPPEITSSVVSVFICGLDREHCVGSGTLIYSKDNEIYYDLYILTAKHVVELYNPGIGLTYKVKFTTGEQYPVNQIFDHKTPADASLLRCRAYRDHAVAALATSAPKPLEEVYAIGYPNQIGPIVTTGIINYKIANDIENSWVCTAPAFYGNSGGGVFYKSTRELVGLTIMIGGTRAETNFTPVPHIHIFIPITFLEDWIKETIHARQGK